MSQEDKPLTAYEKKLRFDAKVDSICAKVRAHPSYRSPMIATATLASNFIDAGMTEEEAIALIIRIIEGIRKRWREEDLYNQHGREG